MFEEKIKELKTTIATKDSEIVAKTAEIKDFLAEDKLEEARNLKKEVTNLQNEKVAAEADLKLFEETKNGTGVENVEGTKVKQEDVISYRESVNEFIRSQGKTVNEGLNFEGKDEVLIPFNQVTPVDPSTDGVKKADVKPVSSEEIIYTPAREVKTVVDLKQFTTIHHAKKATGKYPVLQRATDKLISVAELEKNPKLAKPQFKNVEWAVTTYRGAVPLSQESIDDADVDLVGLVSETIGQMRVNTTNDAIATVLKSFAAKTVQNLDEIKTLLNVDLDPAYSVAFIVSQSFYQILDTLKDKNGRYLLQDSITSATGKVFLGRPVFVLSDDVLGENKAFVGDFKHGVLFADRKDLGLRWVDNELYGQYLQAVLRFGVAKVDEKAGFFVTFTPSEA